MRRLLFLSLFVATTCSMVGCSLYDMMFDTFGSHYSEGGLSSREKRWDYNERVESLGGRTNEF
jgi:hypothetical protein